MNLKSSIEINFNQSELNLLCDALTNESDRWDDMCLNSDTSTIAKNNYESDMVHLDKLLFNLKFAINEKADIKLLLNSLTIGFIIEALENKMENSNMENDQSLENLRNRIKNETLKALGDRFLEVAHYDRNKKQ